MSYTVYLVCCADDTLYCGITTDISRRVIEHNSTKVGAAYTRNRRPVRLVYQEAWPDRSCALKREHEIKQMSREDKLALVAKTR